MQNLQAEWSHPYQQLPESNFWTRVTPEPLVSPSFVDWNVQLADTLGVADLPAEPGVIDAFSGGQPLDCWDPIAQVYSGHQFGQWAGQLGDGRGLYLGVSTYQARSHEWHLKGAGQTPYSRMGDGRSVLRSAIREYLGSEYMAALGIPTTRALCLVRSQTPVRREQMESGATLCRIAKSHLRIGHLEHFYHRQEQASLAQLYEFAFESLDPDLVSLPDRHEEAFKRYIDRSAALVAQWVAVGFVHGVMNTDNTALSGETLDYGPYGFVNHWDPDYVINHTDQGGRYAYGQQPRVMHWNLACLAETLTPFIDVETLQTILATFPNQYAQHFRLIMAQRLALSPENPQLDAIVDQLRETFTTPGAFYPESFYGLLSGGDFQLSSQAALGSSWTALYAQWSAESEPDRHQEALQIAPRWLLSHWLLQSVIDRANTGINADVIALREAIGHGLAHLPAIAQEFGGQAPRIDEPVHLSCSS